MGFPLATIPASKKLEAWGFICVVSGKETVNGVSGMKIANGLPHTWDTNGGVTVAYDEDGKPWVIRGTFDSLDGFKRGAYVPHSNDGGKEIARLFPER